jgi:hypothetical protein
VQQFQKFEEGHKANLNDLQDLGSYSTNEREQSSLLNGRRCCLSPQFIATVLRNPELELRASDDTSQESAIAVYGPDPVFLLNV